MRREEAEDSQPIGMGIPGQVWVFWAISGKPARESRTSPTPRLPQ
jgi:hypothetical protein